MSEKQLEFIKKLLNEKEMSYMELQYKYELGTGKANFLSDDIEELTKYQASWVINKLLAAPKKLTEKQQQAKQDNFKKACDKYNMLLQWAKDQGVKVRARSKKETILSKIREAGLGSQIPKELL